MPPSPACHCHERAAPPPFKRVRRLLTAEMAGVLIIGSMSPPTVAPEQGRHRSLHADHFGDYFAPYLWKNASARVIDSQSNSIKIRFLRAQYQMNGLQRPIFFLFAPPETS